jgi:hypothetical protein
MPQHPPDQVDKDGRCRERPLEIDRLKTTALAFNRGTILRACVTAVSAPMIKSVSRENRYWTEMAARATQPGLQSLLAFPRPTLVNT